MEVIFNSPRHQYKTTDDREIIMQYLKSHTVISIWFPSMPTMQDS